MSHVIGLVQPTDKNDNLAVSEGTEITGQAIIDSYRVAAAKRSKTFEDFFLCTGDIACVDFCPPSGDSTHRRAFCVHRNTCYPAKPSKRCVT